VRATLVIAVIGYASLAIADDAPRPGPDARARAAEHQRAGMIHYNLGEYGPAIAEFRAGYALTAAPGFLFNIAQAQRLSGDCAAAERSYRAYLRAEPQAANRPLIEQRIAEAAHCVAQRPRTADARTETVTAPAAKPDRPPMVTPPAATPPTPSTAGPRRHRLRVIGWTAIGTGAVLGGASVWAGLAARDAIAEVEAAAAAGAAWTTHLDHVDARGQRMEVFAIASGALGAVAIAAGAYALWRDARSTGPELAVTRSQTATKVTVGWRF
jgi:hypothetical protein